MFIKKNDVIVIQGDSITDAGRFDDEQKLGYGYARMLSKYYSEIYPELKLELINRGVSGDRSCDLVRRWQEDVLDLKPAIVTVLIGINDVWRRYDSNDPTSCQTYADNIENIFSRTKEAGIKLLVLEPFVQGHHEWYEDLGPKINALREKAEKYADGYIPLDGLFQKLMLEGPISDWTCDGVHPTAGGHREIAERIIEFFEA